MCVGHTLGEEIFFGDAVLRTESVVALELSSVL